MNDPPNNSPHRTPPTGRSAAAVRDEIRDLVAEYCRLAFPRRDFQPGDPVAVAGRVFDEREVQHLVDSGLDFWLTTGRFAEQFEQRFATRVGVRCASLVNSGSSANLLAVTALTSHKLADRRLQSGDEVITVAAGFPTTVNPILQNGLVPVYVDVEHPEQRATYNIDPNRLEAALSDRTRAVVLAHTLGNPFDCAAVADFCRRHNLWLVEDCCDALGATYGERHVGGFGDIATCSFYPAHHITMGEGGIVFTDSPRLEKLVESFRDWGRDCWCEPGQDDTCGKRFDWQLGELPHGYDHKYIYSHIGYNLKATDMQAAVGVAQLDKLDGFIDARKRNFTRLWNGLEPLSEFFVLPEATPGSSPSWFGFPLSVRPSAPFTRRDLVRHLDTARIGTRQLFGGNLLRQPAYQDRPLRVAGDLAGADYIMRHTLWLGVYPGLTDAHVDAIVGAITTFVLEGRTESR
ncbi:MAG: lipopolysaccharide biosynthesis protein RfbH [Planctomycetota bacterium]|nr:MAG: lipopolysaccharide biosynthesis protein RfbH [Planctomycetota bacterium]